MKHNLPLSAAILLISAAVTCTAYAHPGSTDEYGGHYDHDTGEYHYHHGYEAHSHENGVCPFDFDDKTGWNSGTSSGSTSVYDGFVRPEHTPEPISEDKNTSSGIQKNVLLGMCGAGVLTVAIIFFKKKHEQNKKAIEAAIRRRKRLEEQNYLEQLLKEPSDPLREKAFKYIPDLISAGSDTIKHFRYDQYYKGNEELIRDVCDLQYDAVYASLDDSKRFYHSRISCPCLAGKVSAISTAEASKTYKKCPYCTGGTP